MAYTLNPCRRVECLKSDPHLTGATGFFMVTCKTCGADSGQWIYQTSAVEKWNHSNPPAAPAAPTQAEAVNDKLEELGVPTAPIPVPPHLSFNDLLRVGFMHPESLADLLRVGHRLANDNFDAGFARGLARGMEIATPPAEGCRKILSGGAARCFGRLVWACQPEKCGCRELVCEECRTPYKNECAEHRFH